MFVIAQRALTHSSFSALARNVALCKTNGRLKQGEITF